MAKKKTARTQPTDPPPPPPPPPDPGPSTPPTTPAARGDRLRAAITVMQEAVEELLPVLDHFDEGGRLRAVHRAYLDLVGAPRPPGLEQPPAPPAYCSGDWRTYCEALAIWVRDALRLLTDTEAQAERPTRTGEQTNPPYLTSTEYAILQQLARVYPQLVQITDLAADLNCRRSAAGESARSIENRGLVSRPHGERSGFVITPAGLDALRPEDIPSHLRPHE